MASIKRTLLPLGLAAVLGACSSVPSVQEIPDSGPVIKDVYEQHIAGSADSSPWALPEKLILDDRRDIDGYTRTASTEITGLFPRVPNPDIVGYVYPHLTENGHPVPGYATQFRLFDRDHYALPGEALP